SRARPVPVGVVVVHRRSRRAADHDARGRRARRSAAERLTAPAPGRRARMLVAFPSMEKKMASLRLVTVVGLLPAAAALRPHVPAQVPPNQDKSDKNANPAADPQPRADAGWVARQKELNERAKKGGAELLFLGDSITQGWEGEGKEIWEKRYAPRKALNLGI